MFHNIAPSYLRNLVPQSNRDIHSHNTRNSQNLQTILCRTTFYSNSFLPSVIRDWNELSAEVKNSSLSVFKNCVYIGIKVPSFYNCDSRIGQIYHARLRLECSS